MPKIPPRSAELPRSGIRAVMDLAWASTAPVIRLEVGQPDAAPPEHVLEAITASIQRKETGYTPNAGIPELRAACADKLARVNRIHVDADQVLITAGSMQGLSATALALADPGDEVLVPDPGWPNYRMVSRLTSLQAVPYPLRRETGYRPDFDELAHLVGERTRMVVINSPSNPLGVVWDAAVMSDWVRFAEEHDLWIVSDECYDQIVLDDLLEDAGVAEGPAAASSAVAVSPAALPGGSERVVTVHSFSKTYAMTGLRVGYVSGPPEVLATMVKMQEALVACVNGPAQHGAVAALQGPQEFVSERRESYRRRRDRAIEVSDELGLPYQRPSGAFYLWLPLRLHGRSGVELAEELVRDAGVAVAPGETFGSEGEGAIRVSLAAAEDDIAAGLRRIVAHLG